MAARFLLRRAPVLRSSDTFLPTRGAGGTRGAKGWGWFFKAKEEIARGEAAPPSYPENLDPAVPRPRVFLDIEVEDVDEVGGRMVFELAADILPKTCENFVKLCTNEGGEAGGLGYKGTRVHHLRRGQYFAGGDVDGKGGRAAVFDSGGQRFFEDESFAVPHSNAGVLSMVSHGKDRNGSQFMVSLASVPHHDGRHVGFGRLVEGEDLLQGIDGLLAVRGKPLSTIKVVDCGVLE